MKDISVKEKQEMVDAIDDRIRQLTDLMFVAHKLEMRCNCKLCKDYFKGFIEYCKNCPARKMFGPFDEGSELISSFMCIDFMKKVTAIRVAILEARGWLEEQKEKILKVNE